VKAKSVQEVIDYGEVDLLYNVVTKNGQNDDQGEINVIGINLINFVFNKKKCQLILLKNWTNTVRQQLSKQAKQVQDMMTATFSHEIRTPISAIMTMIESLMLMTNSPEQT
jgi:signal transduction histidine kinase